MSSAPTERTRVRRLPDKGVYEPQAIYAILDEALICHLAYTAGDGDPRVIPTIHARIGDTLYVHGSRASQTLRALRDGVKVAVAVTLIDEIRFARSMFEHSMNYRSAVVYGEAHEVTDPDELRRLFTTITDHVAPGRAADARPPDDEELKQTLFLKIPLDEASAKVSTGHAKDAEKDYELDVWAGLLPIAIVPGAPIPDPRNKPGLETPAYVRDYRRPGRA
jgi:nitroimidazol reductase NimA-like FMN-containing flavoprotein (pyridoxamine 5'-phosphate oxidase superfamily)